MHQITTPLSANGKNGKRNNFTIVGASPKIEELRRTITRAAKTDITVVITGERGTGKELVARAVYAESRRSSGKLITVNCAAIPSELVESELFGHAKGAFTGAVYSKKGKFELADKGTLFLDEIGDMPLTTQAKLLRALEYREFERVGGLETMYVDVRFISATNKNLIEEIEGGRFRSDLYDRVNVFEICVPPLREHLEDVPLLVRYFLGEFNSLSDTDVKLADNAQIRFIQIAPGLSGNIRELRSLVERCAVYADGGIIDENNAALSNRLNKGKMTAIVPEKIENNEISRDRIILAIIAIGPFELSCSNGRYHSESYEKLAERMQVSVGELKKFLSKTELSSMIKEERKRIIVAARTDGKSKKQLAEELGLRSAAEVVRHCKALGIELKK